MGAVSLTHRNFPSGSSLGNPPSLHPVTPNLHRKSLVLPPLTDTTLSVPEESPPIGLFLLPKGGVDLVFSSRTSFGVAVLLAGDLVSHHGDRRHDAESTFRTPVVMPWSHHLVCGAQGQTSWRKAAKHGHEIPTLRPT